MTQQRGQDVFASSAEPRTSAAKRDRGAGRTSGPTVSERSATSDIWANVDSAGARSSLASADAMGGDGGGLSGGLVAAIAVLGLALAGITGGALATAGRRRAAARAAKH